MKERVKENETVGNRVRASREKKGGREGEQHSEREEKGANGLC